MTPNWRTRCRSLLESGRSLKAGWLVAAGLIALYVGAIRPYQAAQGIHNSMGTGLSSYTTDAIRQRQPRSRASVEREARGVVGGVPGNTGATQANVMAATYAPSSPESNLRDDGDDRRMVRTSSMELVVQKAGEVAEKIRVIAENGGGFLVSSEVRGDRDMNAGSVTIRVPTARFEEARAEIRELSVRVESEKIEAEDVTRQYVDRTASLRNLQAEEGQYLAILKQARTVKDTLEVSEKLSDVHSQIEQQKAEFQSLAKRVETVAISVSLRTEAEERVLGINWRPLYELKLALREGLDGVADYASSMLVFFFFLPTIILWLATILGGCAMGWKLLRWLGRKFLGWKPAIAPAQG